MDASSLVMMRRRRQLTGLLCLMGPTHFWCRRAFCPRAKPPPRVQAPSPTTALHPSATRSAVPHPLPLTENLMLLPPVLPDPLTRLLFVLLLLPHTRRRRTPATALHVQPQSPKLEDPLWMLNSLPSYSSSSGTTLEEPEPSAVKTPHWVFSMYNHRVSSSQSTRTTMTTTVKPQVNMASSDRATVLGLFLHRGAN